MYPAFLSRIACGASRRVKSTPSALRIGTLLEKGPKLAPCGWMDGWIWMGVDLIFLLIGLS